MKIVSVILARGGSKEIPNKNIIDLCGKPMISYAIKTSLMTSVEETWVSTDDEKIMGISADCGAKILTRPAVISQDTSTSEEALLHFADNVDFDILVFIQPTSPLLIPVYIDLGLVLLKDYDSVFSVYNEHWNARFNRNLKPIGWDGIYRPRRQEMPIHYVENGAFYITTKESLLRTRCRYNLKNSGVIGMPLWRSFQVDTMDDLHLMKRLIKCSR